MNQKMLATSSVSQPNSYQRYHPFRWLLLFVHCLLILGVLTILSKNWYWFFVCALSHLLIILNDSACYAGHCQSVLATTSWQIDCSECGCRRWIRMKHCYRCRKCVHKYDHHCLFLDMCIGEFNQKYYILFLWTYLCNLLAVSQEILSWLPPEVTVDERGIEHISWRYFWYALTMIACLFNLTLIVYLCGLHTFMSLVNQTSSQYYNRPGAGYLSHIKQTIQHPFDRGVLNNLQQIVQATHNQPKVWRIQVQNENLLKLIH